ncbi:hypothetical protein C0992_002277 [Termitomyces sp. T32_za158]|nr:hypothetical protein C0992_002277 [Termitomyces sp. T32_za158]
MGKKGDRAAHSRASAFLLQSSLVPKLFTTFAERYANRPGGYTRIHKLGNRPGDNAPRAVLELVDNPRDLRWEMTARSVGWEVVKERLRTTNPLSVINKGPVGTQEVVEKELSMKFDQPGGLLRPKTRSYLQKVMRYRNVEARAEMSKKVGEYMDHLLATPMVTHSMHQEAKEKNVQSTPQRQRAGQIQPGETRPALSLAQGALGHRRPPPKERVLSMRLLFGRKYKRT